LSERNSPEVLPTSGLLRAAMRDAATLSFVDNSVIAVADHNSPKK
jgi:hypothetical protein